MMGVFDRLNKHIKKDAISGCWNWTGSLTSNGYGKLVIAKKPKRAHRISYELHVGPIGLFHVCHKCDNIKCINPEHLFLGTPKDNMQDCIKKGRNKNPPLHCGERQHSSKLTAEIVKECRRLRKIGVTVSDLADEFGISPGCMHKVISGKSWKHIS